MKESCWVPIFIFLTLNSMAQNNNLPFAEIPPPPKEYRAGAVIARMIEGLGFRYYWATEGLVTQDLNYRPTIEAKSTLETLVHLYTLCEIIKHVAQNKPNVRPPQSVPEDFENLRKETLNFLQEAANTFKGIVQVSLKKNQVVFERQEQRSEFPLWNLLNGPLADALYHTGQVVSFRRTTGNPIDKGVNVFLGKKNL